LKVFSLSVVSAPMGVSPSSSMHSLRVASAFARLFFAQLSPASGIADSASVNRV